MSINWTLRLLTGTVVREKDSATVKTTLYGSGNDGAFASADTEHTKQIWVDPGDGSIVSVQLKGTQNVSASPGDRVRVVFADPGSHVVGLRNENLQTSWEWKFPSNSGCLALLAALALFALPVSGLIALWREDYLVGLALLALFALIALVPMPNRRRRIAELRNARARMLS